MRGKAFHAEPRSVLEKGVVQRSRRRQKEGGTQLSRLRVKPLSHPNPTPHPVP